MKLLINANYDAVSEAVKRMEEQLKHWKTASEERIPAILTLEELLVKLVDTAAPGEKIAIQLRRTYRKVAFRLSCRGEQVQIDPQAADVRLVGEEYGPEAEEVIRNMILAQSQDQLSLKYSRGINTIVLTVHRNEKAAIYDTLVAIGLAFVIALGLRFTLPFDLVQTISGYIFTPFYDIFMRAIMMILAPMIFFSLASCIANITDLSALGRTSVKVLSCYMTTTFIAIFAAMGMYYLIQPGVGTQMTLPTTGDDYQVVETSILKTIIDIVPNSFIGAFAANNILQVLFLGIITGIAVGASGKYAEPLRNGMEALNTLAQTILRYVVKVMPLAIFGAVGNMVCTLDVSAFGLLGGYILTIFLTYIVMQLIYMLLIRTVGGLNPLPFVRKYLKVQLTALSTGSSCVTMPVSMQTCRSMGISPKIFNFSIPLGTTINMDGASISFTISGLFLAGIYGIPIDAGTMISFLITVVLLSMAAPPVPGAGIACLVIVLNSLGIPLEAATLLVGILPFIDITDTVNNVVGDGSVTLIVANSEHQLDKKQYYSK